MMILKSSGRVPMDDGQYYGKITGDLVNVRVILFDDVLFTTSFHVETGVRGIEIPVTVIVKDALANVYVED